MVIHGSSNAWYLCLSLYHWIMARILAITTNVSRPIIENHNVEKKSQRLSKATFSLDRFWNNLDSASKYLQNEMNFVSCSQIALMLSSRWSRRSYWNVACLRVYSTSTLLTTTMNHLPVIVVGVGCVSFMQSNNRGPTNSGKTTLSENLLALLCPPAGPDGTQSSIASIEVLHQDDFFRPLHELPWNSKFNVADWDTPHGAVSFGFQSKSDWLSAYDACNILLSRTQKVAGWISELWATTK